MSEPRVTVYIKPDKSLYITTRGLSAEANAAIKQAAEDWQLKRGPTILVIADAEYIFLKQDGSPA